MLASTRGAEPIAFDIPAGDAAVTLKLFSRQAGVQLVYPTEIVRGHWTRPVRAEISPCEALAAMLAGTGLLVVTDDATGALAIASGESHRAHVRDGRVQTNPVAPVVMDLAGPPDDGSDDVTVLTLSPFEVRSDQDTGYRAANSVSATRMAIPIGLLPLNIAAFTEDFITDQKAYDLYDIVKWTPGVHQDNLSPQGWSRYNIRGFTSAAIQRNGFRAFRFIDTSNIARVEVVKGPASLLYGQINPGGVINYITKRPETTPSVALTGSIGTHGHNRWIVDATGPVPATNGRLLYRAIAMTEAIQEFKELSRGRKYLFAPSAKWNLAEQLSLLVEFEHFERLDEMPTSGVPLIYAGGVATDPYPGLPWDFSYAGEGDYQDFISDAVTVELNAGLGEHMALRAVYLDAYWDMEWRATGQGALGLLAQPFIDYYYPPSAGLTPTHAMYRRNRWEHQWGGERSAQVDCSGEFARGGIRVRALLGAKRNFETRQWHFQKNNPNIAGHPAYLRPWDMRNPATWDRRVPFGLDALVAAANNFGASSGTSVYGVLAITALEDRLQLLGGYARHGLRNHAGQDFLQRRVTPGSKRAANVPQFGALYRLSPALSGFAGYSESFLANGSMLRVNNVPTTMAAPSVGRGWEAGVKVELLAGRISGTISTYAVDASPTGIIVVTSGVDASGTTLFTDIQGGRQESAGVEAELLLTPGRGWQIMASYGRCDATYTQHPSNRALDGAPLVGTPEQVFNLWTKYTLRTERAGTFTFGGGVNHVGTLPHVGNNPAARLPAYTTADLMLGCTFHVRGHEWNAEISVKNVTDERYLPSASSWGFPRHAMVSLGTCF